MKNLYFLFVVLFLASCGKDDPTFQFDNSNLSDPQALLSNVKIRKITYADFPGDSVIFEFNSNKSLSKVISYENTNNFESIYTFEYIYNANQRVEKIKITDDYTNLGTNENFLDIEEVLFTYNEKNQLVKLSDSGDESFERTYDENGRLIKEEAFSGEETSYYDTFLWEDNNVSEENWFSPNESGGRKFAKPLVKFSKHSLYSARVNNTFMDTSIKMESYDDRVNPLRFSITYSLDVEGYYMSRNNVTEVTYVDFGGSVIIDTSTETYDYTYNTDGLPTEVVVTDVSNNPEEPFVINIEYL